MKQPKSLRTRALEILSRRETSRTELKRKLMPYAQNEEELERILAECTEHKWQSDERFAEAYIHSKSHRYGARRLEQSLSEKGVSAATISRLLPSHTDELSNAKQVLRKKFKHAAANPTEKQKQMRFLAYRGFSTDTILQALKTAWENDEA